MQNSHVSLEDVLSKYSTMVYRIAFSRVKNQADSDDIMQEVFLRLIKADVDFLDDDEHVKAWLIRATMNCSINLLKSAWNTKTSALSDDDESLIVEMEDSGDVLSAVMALPKKYRTVVHMFYFEDMKIEEICAASGQKTGTVKSILSRARKILKEKLKEEYDFK